MLRIGIVGCGTIGAAVAHGCAKHFKGRARVVAVNDADPVKARALARGIAGARVLASERLIAASDLVLEAASARVSAPLARRVLGAGKQILVMSVGGLLGRTAALERLAAQKGGRLYVPSGAIAGLDAVRAFGFVRWRRLVLRTQKPPAALEGADYLVKRRIRLSGLRAPRTVFRGTAAQAVRAFPKNINVVAALALAAGGGVVPHVEIVADPRLGRNVHTIMAESAGGRITITCENVPSVENPKTSRLAILSALAVIGRLVAPVSIGN
ncbi:MAG: aspartate dehydrogenase domain-containing protein [Deltaproteobacteria bacterium]